MRAGEKTAAGIGLALGRGEKQNHTGFLRRAVSRHGFGQRVAF